MTKIVFPQVQHGYKLENMKSAAFPYLWCLVCKQNQVEDEQHFLMFCNGYNVLRQEFINFILSEDVAFVNLTAHDRIKYRLTADNNTCKTTAKFINLMFKKRKELLKM